MEQATRVRRDPKVRRKAVAAEAEQEREKWQKPKGNLERPRPDTRLEVLPQRTQERILRALEICPDAPYKTGAKSTVDRAPNWDMRMPPSLLWDQRYWLVSPQARSVWQMLMARRCYLNNEAHERYREEYKADPRLAEREYVVLGQFAKKEWLAEAANVRLGSLERYILELQYFGLLRRRLGKTRHGYCWWYILYDRIQMDRCAQDDEIDPSNADYGWNEAAMHDPRVYSQVESPRRAFITGWAEPEVLVPDLTKTLGHKV